VPFPTSAAQDLLALLRSMYLAEREPHRRRVIESAGLDVRLAIDVAKSDPRSAHDLVNKAVESVFNVLHMNAGIQPPLAAAAKRVKRGCA
jgi:hypothetical protein